MIHITHLIHMNSQPQPHISLPPLTPLPSPPLYGTVSVPVRHVFQCSS